MNVYKQIQDFNYKLCFWLSCTCAALVFAYYLIEVQLLAKPGFSLAAVLLCLYLFHRQYTKAKKDPFEFVRTACPACTSFKPCEASNQCPRLTRGEDSERKSAVYLSLSAFFSAFPYMQIDTFNSTNSHIRITFLKCLHPLLQHLIS
jgi:hypothetical protein